MLPLADKLLDALPFQLLHIPHSAQFAAFEPSSYVLLPVLNQRLQWVCKAKNF
jgi:hypothetical protein